MKKKRMEVTIKTSFNGRQSRGFFFPSWVNIHILGFLCRISMFRNLHLRRRTASSFSPSFLFILVLPNFLDCFLIYIYIYCLMLFFVFTVLTVLFLFMFIFVFLPYIQSHFFFFFFQLLYIYCSFYTLVTSTLICYPYLSMLRQQFRRNQQHSGTGLYGRFHELRRDKKREKGKAKKITTGQLHNDVWESCTRVPADKTRV